MCGIAGVIGQFSKAEGLLTAKRMSDSFVYRGPDDSGSWAQDGFAFSMRRLSIIDLETGSQPMWTEDGIGIICNGEIYNYRQLREELVKSGYLFKTKSDTEVALYIYHKYGIEGIKYFEGMFALCIFDPGRKAVYLVRDRLGIKPLYYGTQNNVFYFASEIKAILAAMPSRPEIALQSLYHYLSLRYIPGPETAWQNIYKLQPGSYLKYDLVSRKWDTVPYWKLKFNSAALEIGRDYQYEFEKLFLDSVERYLVSADVPVGVLLSGGLDSSAVSAAAIEMGHRNFHTFSVAFDQGGVFDETGYAQEVARHLGSQHHEIRIGEKEFLDFLPEFVRYTDEPLADLASVPLYYVCRLAREKVKVVLTGEGSDEVFCGYQLDLLAKRLCRLKAAASLVPHSVLDAISPFFSRRQRDILRNLLHPGGWANSLNTPGVHMTYYWTEEEKCRFWKDTASLVPTEGVIRSWYEQTHSQHPLDRLQQVFCGSWLVEDLLMKADRMSMANSLELRVPFLNHKIVEWSFSLPLAWKVGDQRHGYSSKKILRSFARKRLPQTIINRPKLGFPVPAYGWLRGHCGAWAEDLIFERNNFLHSLLDMSIIRPVFAAARKGDLQAAHKIWDLIVLELWGKAWR